MFEGSRYQRRTRQGAQEIHVQLQEGRKGRRSQAPVSLLRPLAPREGPVRFLDINDTPTTKLTKAECALADSPAWRRQRGHALLPSRRCNCRRSADLT